MLRGYGWLNKVFLTLYRCIPAFWCAESRLGAPLDFVPSMSRFGPAGIVLLFLLPQVSGLLLHSQLQCPKRQGMGGER